MAIDLAALALKLETRGLTEAQRGLAGLDTQGKKTGRTFDDVELKALAARSALQKMGLQGDALDKTLGKMGIGGTTAAAALARLSTTATQATGAGQRLTTGMSAAGQAAHQAGAGARAWTAGLAQLKAQQEAALASSRALRAEAAASGLAYRNAAPGLPGLGGPPTTVAGGLGGLLTGGIGGRAFAGGLIGGIAGGAAFTAISKLVSGVTSTFTDGIKEADAYEASLRRLNATARLTGVAVGDIAAVSQRAEKELGLNAQQAADLTANVTRLTARAGQTSRSFEVLQAVLDLTGARGLSTADAMQVLESTLIGQDEGLNRLGLANPQQFYEEWARAAGTAAATMTETQKAQALLNAFTHNGAKVQGEWASRMETSAGKAEQAARSTANFRREVGLLVQPVRNAWSALKEWSLGGIAEGLKNVREEMAKVRQEGGLVERALRNAAGLPQRGAKPSARPSGMLPELSVTAKTPEQLAAEVDELTRAIALGTASNAQIREAIRVMQERREVARTETLELKKRNDAAAQAQAIEDALSDRRAKEIAQIGALVDLRMADTKDLERAKVLEREVTALLDKKGLSRAREIEYLQQRIDLQRILATLPNPDAPSRNVSYANAVPGAPSDQSPWQGPVAGMPGAIPSLLGPRGGAIGKGQSSFGAENDFTAKFAVATKKRIEDLREEIATSMASMGRDVALAFGEGLANGLASDKPLQALGNTVLSGLGSIFTSMGAELMEYGSIMIGLQGALSNPFTSGPAALAAGILLTAVGKRLGGIALGSHGGGGKGKEPQSYIHRVFVGGDGVARETTTQAGGSPAPAFSPSRSIPIEREMSSLRAPQPTINVTVFGENDPTLPAKMARVVNAAYDRGMMKSGR